MKDRETRHMMKELEKYFETKVDIPLIRQGRKQKIETLINEETMLLAKYMREKLFTWVPRVYGSEIYPQGINSDSNNNKIC